MGPAGSVPTGAGVTGTSCDGLLTSRSRREGLGTGVSPRTSSTLRSSRARELDPGAAQDAGEGPGHPEAGRCGAQRLDPAAAVGVEAAVDDRQLRLVGVAGDQSGVAGGDERGGLLALRRVVAFDLGLTADRRAGHGVVDPDHGDERGEAHDDRDADGGGAEADEPALGVEAQESTDSGEEGDQPEDHGGEERDEEPPRPPGDLPVEQAGRQHLGDLGGVVQPAQAVEESAGPIGGRQLGEDLLDHVVAERRVDRRARVDEVVVRVVLVAVDDADLLLAVVGLQDEVARQGDIGGARAVDDRPDHVRRPRRCVRRGCRRARRGGGPRRRRPMSGARRRTRRASRGWARSAGLHRRGARNRRRR